MADITFGSDLPNHFRIKDLFSEDPGVIMFQTTDSQTIATVFDSAGAEVLARYYALVPGRSNENFPIARITTGPTSTPSFIWDSSDAPLTVDDLKAFHQGKAASVAVLMKGNDTITGGLNENFLEGFAGNDIIDGGNDSDKLIGGRGKDTLIGGDDDDVFVFQTVKDSKVNIKGRDVISDFSRKEGDRIDLRAIDANEDKSGDQRFKFIDDDEFHKKAGELMFEKFIDGLVVKGDTDGDGKADFSIQLDGSLGLKAGDFML